MTLSTVPAYCASTVTHPMIKTPAEWKTCWNIGWATSHGQVNASGWALGAAIIVAIVLVIKMRGGEKAGAKA